MLSNKPNSSFDAGFKYTVDMWDGDVRRYQLDDEEIGGQRCFQNFPDARNFAVQRLEKKMIARSEKLDKTRQHRMKDVK